MYYHNTNKLTNDELKEANDKAFTQEEAILDIFEDKEVRLTPSDVWVIYCRDFKDVPLTSIRRAITNLTHRYKLYKCDDMRKGMYGKMEHCWKIRSNDLSNGQLSFGGF